MEGRKGGNTLKNRVEHRIKPPWLQRVDSDRRKSIYMQWKRLRKGVYVKR